LSGGVNAEREEPAFRRQSPAYDEPRGGRGAGNYGAAPSKSALPAIALVVAILGVVGAGFLGFQLMAAQALIAKDAARIQQLENQLNTTSSESTQSVAALGINLQKLDGEVKKLWDVTKKSNAEQGEKIAALGKGIDATKVDIAAVKAETTAIKQDTLAQRASIDELAPRVDASDKNIAEQRKKIADVSAGVNVIAGQLKSAEGLASRITRTEEAIDAIDDNRRSINKDIVQIKQVVGIKN
jgi:chromosome segregation ATPase